MEKLLLLLLFMSLCFTSCGGDDEEDYVPEPNRNIEFKIINKTNHNFTSVSISVYKYKNDKSENDFIIHSGNLNSGEEITKRTFYKYVNILCLYEKELGDGMKPQTIYNFYPTKSTFYELKENDINIIELK